jgi:hypothetical protein
MQLVLVLEKVLQGQLSEQLSGSALLVLQLDWLLDWQSG